MKEKMCKHKHEQHADRLAFAINLGPISFQCYKKPEVIVKLPPSEIYFHYKSEEVRVCFP